MAVLVPSNGALAWHAACVRRLVDEGAAHFVLLASVTISDRPDSGRDSKGAGVSTSWKLYARLLKRRIPGLAPAPAEWCAAADQRIELHATPVSSDGDPAYEVDEHQARAVSAHQPDIVLAFGLGEPKGPILDVSPAGIWALGYDLGPRVCGVPAELLRLTSHARAARLALVRFRGSAGGHVLQEAMVATGWRHFGACTKLFTRSTDLCLRAARGRLIAADIDRESATCERRARRPLATNALFRLLLDQLLAWARAKFSASWTREEWNVGIAPQPLEALIRQDRLEGVRWLGDHRGRTYLADPLVMSDERDTDGGTLAFLAEHFEWAGRARGTIVRCTFRADGSFECVPFFEAPHHLSYPFVLQDRGKRWLIPEATESGQLSFFPISDSGDLGPPRLLAAPGPGVDPTLIRYGGRLWLFCSDGSETLYAFHADDLKGPFEPHALNPLKVDVRCSRPAGPLFEHRGDLYRPAQNCLSSYGAAVVVHRILELTPERFAEELVAEIGPETGGSYPLGFHTLTSLGDCCLVDGKRRVFDPLWVLRGRRHARQVRARGARLRGEPG